MNVANNATDSGAARLFLRYLQLAADSYKPGQEGTGDQTKSAPERQQDRKMERGPNRETWRGGWRQHIPNLYSVYAETVCVCV